MSVYLKERGVVCVIIRNNIGGNGRQIYPFNADGQAGRERREQSGRWQGEKLERRLKDTYEIRRRNGGIRVQES